MLRIFPFDKTGVSEALAQFEENHDILLPEEYRTFLINYNGGNALQTSFKIKKESSDIRAFYGFENADYEYNFQYFLDHDFYPSIFKLATYRLQRIVLGIIFF